MDKLIEETERAEQVIEGVAVALKNLIRAGREFLKQVQDVIDQEDEEEEKQS